MEYPLDVTQYELVREVTNNEYCSTYIARCLFNGKLVCLRKFNLEENIDLMKIIGEETRNWSTISHPNMMKYYASFVELNFLYIISEFIDQGSLLDILHFQCSGGIKDEFLISSILKQILTFLKYYHQIHQIHRLLETRNIYLSQDGIVKVGGFWQAKSLLSNGFLKKERDSSIDSSCYTAPELIEQGKCYSQSVDIWSLGIIAYELAIGKTPYSDYEPLRQIKEIISGPSPSLPFTVMTKRRFSMDSDISKEMKSKDGFSPIFGDFIQQCLSKDPYKRPSAADLLKHKFILLSQNSNYISVNLMMHLPPLSQRIILKNISKSDENIILPKSPDQIPLLTNDDDDCQNRIVKKGRFTLTYPKRRSPSLL